MAAHTLAETPVGREVRIDRLEEDPSVSRLLAMGIRPGVVVTLVRRAAFGEVLYIRSAVQQFGLRREEAQRIWVVANT